MEGVVENTSKDNKEVFDLQVSLPFWCTELHEGKTGICTLKPNVVTSKINSKLHSRSPHMHQQYLRTVHSNHTYLYFLIRHQPHPLLLHY